MGVSSVYVLWFRALVVVGILVNLCFVLPAATRAAPRLRRLRAR